MYPDSSRWNHRAEALTKVGYGTLNLGSVDNSNSFSGNLLIEAGYVAASTENSLGSPGDSALIFDGGGLRATSSYSITASSEKEIDVDAGGAIFDTNGYDLIISTCVGYPGDGAAGGITVVNSGSGGMLTLSGDNIFSGETLIDTGATLQLGRQQR